MVEASKFFASLILRVHISGDFSEEFSVGFRSDQKVGLSLESLQKDDNLTCRYLVQISFDVPDLTTPFNPLEGLVLDIKDDGMTHTYSVTDLVHQRLLAYPLLALRKRFDQMVVESTGSKVLDIGGRQRSVFNSRDRLGEVQLTIFDVVDSEGVDVVGDAHRLSSYFEPNSFDFVLSVSVFEHLHSPWVVLREINRVLKPGGQVLIQTHQTVGMHDLPFDFWRYSADLWPYLLNSESGFEILDSVQDHEMHVIPFVYSNRHAEAERTAGFEVSCVLARKVSESLQPNWIVPSLTAGTYAPNGDTR